jgi:hypothetical protein
MIPSKTLRQATPLLRRRTRDPRPGKRLEKTSNDVIRRNGERMIEEGQQIFRFDTFGDEAFWGDTLKLHQAIEGARFGGVGPGVSPAPALAVGLKVDAEALSSEVVSAIRHGRVDLNDPAVTLALLEANAVVGVTGHPGNNGGLASVGIQCSLCHSTVDNSVAPGIGRCSILRHFIQARGAALECRQG